MYKIIRYSFIILIIQTFLCLEYALIAQQTTQSDTSTNGEIEIIFQQKLRTVITDGREVNHFQGDVVFKHDDVFIFCDTGTKEDKLIRAWGNVVIKQGDTLNIFSDRLFYDGNIKIADLERNVVLENRDQKLFTRRLKYDVSRKIATYTTGATLTDDKTYLRSRRGNYFVTTSEAYFKDSVVVLDPEFSLKTDSLLFNSNTKIATFLGPTLISYDNSRIYTEGGFYDIENKYAVFNKNPQYLSDKQRSKAETIIYDGQSKEVMLVNEAIFEEEDKVAKADTILFYETTDLVDLMGNARYKEDRRTANGDRMIYDRKSQQFKSPNRITINDPPQFLEADRLDFDNETGLGIAIGKVIWQDTAQDLTIFCEEAQYNKSKDYIKAWGGRPILMIEMDDEHLFVSGDTLLSYKIPTIEYEHRKTANSGSLSGVIINPDSVSVDSLNKSEEVFSDIQNIETDLDRINPSTEKKNKTSKASVDNLTGLNNESKGQSETNTNQEQDKTKEKVTLSEVDLEKLYQHDPIIESDTSFIGYETLLNQRTDSLLNTYDSTMVGPIIPDSLYQEQNLRPDTIKLMLVYHDVKIYKKDMRGLCDSLAFNTLDSIFTFYREPIIWSDSTQFTGDTIAMVMKEKKIDRMDILSNALVISTPNEVYYDQIKGKLINAHFNNGNIDNVLVTGNAETVYYVTDKEDAYNGVNSKQASKIRIFFKEKEMTNIRFYTKPDGKFFPMGKADHEGLKLSGFNWQLAKRPESHESITNLDWIEWSQLIPSTGQTDSEENQIPDPEDENSSELNGSLKDERKNIDSLGETKENATIEEKTLVNKSGNQ